MAEPRVFQAENAGLFALGGTRTFVVGERRVAIIDPGPDDAGHLGRVAGAVSRAEEGVILVTHDHPDHSAGVRTLAELTGFPVAGAMEGVELPLGDGGRVEVDGGELVAVATSGHARDHLAFLELPGRALFAGDLLIGEGSTTWVGEYSGCVADYLESLDRVEALEPSRIHPAHGPSLDEPAEVIRRFRRHRLERLRQVEVLLAELDAAPDPLLPPDHPAWMELAGRLVDRIYGEELPAGLRLGAIWSVRAMLEYLDEAPFPSRAAPTEGGDSLEGV